MHQAGVLAEVGGAGKEEALALSLPTHDHPAL